jgi:ABC-type lipoprotein export system ATPase subunit
MERKLALQVCNMDAIPHILLKKAGESSFTELQKLSLGEKCSAILSIALLQKDKPLVIDQPEDELDPSFIGENIVEAIRKVKGQRQLVFCTKDPNIPVLGDAELVLKVRKEPGVPFCRVEAQGSLEEPEVMRHIQGLEGGVEAFEKRRRKYGASLVPPRVR